MTIPHICHFFYTGKIFGKFNLHQKTPIFRIKSVKKNPLFRVKSVENAKSVKIYTDQNFFLINIITVTIPIAIVTRTIIIVIIVIIVSLFELAAFCVVEQSIQSSLLLSDNRSL